MSIGVSGCGPVTIEVPVKKEEIVKVVNDAILKGEIKIDYGPACKKKDLYHCECGFTSTKINEMVHHRMISCKLKEKTDEELAMEYSCSVFGNMADLADLLKHSPTLYYNIKEKVDIARIAFIAGRKSASKNN